MEIYKWGGIGMDKLRPEEGGVEMYGNGTHSLAALSGKTTTQGCGGIVGARWGLPGACDSRRTHT